MLNEFFEKGPEYVDNGHMEDYADKLLNGGFLWTGTPDSHTQKGRGIFHLLDNKKVIKSALNWNVPNHLIFPAGSVFQDDNFNFPVFARPCPIMPRHGFVDSELCHDSEELNVISIKTSEVEPAAELLVTKPIDCHYNVVINGDVITFALGNDGATSGKGCRYFYISDDPLNKLLKLDETNLVAEEEVPFYEIVLSKDINKPVHLVQVRSAPKTPRVKDYVPAPVEVKTILRAEGDLLAWESQLKKVDSKTTIIDHTDGSLSSHYAIHAIVNKIPIFTSYVPSLGSIIEPTVEDTEITDFERDAFFKAFVRGFSSTPKVLTELKYMDKGMEQQKKVRKLMNEIVVLALAALHNYSSIALSKDFEVLGIVLGLFCRTAFAVSAGESRYAKELGKNEIFKEFLERLPTGEGRLPCYKYMISVDTAQCLKDVAIIQAIFDVLPWSGNFGGKKWSRCNGSTIKLFNACVNKEINQVVELFNAVINEEHNGGKYLNKVIDIYEFDKASKDTAMFTLSHLQKIVDILHTSWNVSLEGGNLEALFTPIRFDIKYYNSLQHPTVRLQNDVGQNNKFPNLVLTYKGMEYALPLPKPFKPEKDKCFMTCCHKHRPVLYSSPYWWTVDGNQKVVSKPALTKMIKKKIEEIEAAESLKNSTIAINSETVDNNEYSNEYSF